MEAILVVTLSIEEPEEVAEVIKAMNPVKLPYFAGVVLVAVDEPARTVVKWLSEENPMQEAEIYG